MRGQISGQTLVAVIDVTFTRGIVFSMNGQTSSSSLELKEEAWERSHDTEEEEEEL